MHTGLLASFYFLLFLLRMADFYGFSIFPVIITHSSYKCLCKCSVLEHAAERRIRSLRRGSQIKHSEENKWRNVLWTQSMHFIIMNVFNSSLGTVLLEQITETRGLLYFWDTTTELEKEIKENSFITTVHTGPMSTW